MLFFKKSNSFQVNLRLLFQVVTSLKHLYMHILQLVSPAPLFPEPFSKTSSFSCPSDSVKLLSANFIAYSFIVTWYCPLRQLPGPFFSSLFLLSASFFIAFSFIVTRHCPLRQSPSTFLNLSFFSLLPSMIAHWDNCLAYFFYFSSLSSFITAFLSFPYTPTSLQCQYPLLLLLFYLPSLAKWPLVLLSNGTRPGGQLNDDFTITKKPMWSPYQIRSDDSRDIKTAFEFLTQKREKVYNGPNGDPINNLTLAQLCTLIYNDAETGGVDTFLYAPDSSGKVWCMTRHHTWLTFEETKKYVDHCICLETFIPDIDTKTGNPTADSLTKSRQIFDDQALDDSSHLWHLIVSYISPNLLTGLLERLEDYGNRGPGLLL